MAGGSSLITPVPDTGGGPDDDAGCWEITDAELTALALAADPDQPLDPDAAPLSLIADPGWSALPSWYMPPVMMRGASRWRTGVVVTLVAAFLLINALGLCITYGQLGAA
jgi:hypothetical protein